jgi:SAM-dependent methyltransferase
VVSPDLAVAQPFDALAPEYDAVFTDRLLGRWLRAMVWDDLSEVFPSGGHILELGCGTGEDAVWLALRGHRVTAADASDAMLDVARAKALRAGVADRITFTRLDLREVTTPDDLPLSEQYDGVLSNFGALNCLPSRRRLAGALAARVVPGANVVLVVMGPVCPWESAWFLLHGDLRSASRRWRGGAQAHVGEGALRVWYPSLRTLRREMAPHFRLDASMGVGLLLPPSEHGRLVERAPRLFRPLAAIDRRARRTPLWRWCGDHYLARLSRT